jgi:outer membrane protein TolC
LESELADQYGQLQSAYERLGAALQAVEKEKAAKERYCAELDKWKAPLF